MIISKFINNIKLPYDKSMNLARFLNIKDSKECNNKVKNKNFKFKSKKIERQIRKFIESSNKTKKNNHFMGGKKVKESSIFLLGQIRAGRPKKIKDKLISELKNVLVKQSKLDETQVWVYIVNLPPSQMIEYGEVLPESGKEKLWFSKLSKKLKKKLSKIGH